MSKRCEQCGQHSLLRRKKTWFERARYLYSTERPFKCTECGNEQWLDTQIPEREDRRLVMIAMIMVFICLAGFVIVWLLGDSA